MSDEQLRKKVLCIQCEKILEIPLKSKICYCEKCKKEKQKNSAQKYAIIRVIAKLDKNRMKKEENEYGNITR